MRRAYIGSREFLRDGYIMVNLEFRERADADEVERAVEAFTLMDARDMIRIGFFVINGRVERGGHCEIQM